MRIFLSSKSLEMEEISEKAIYCVNLNETTF